MFDGKWIEVDANGVGWEMDSYHSGTGTVFAHQQTNAVQIPMVVTNFYCPVCGSKKYDPIYKEKEFPPFTANTVIGPGSNAGWPQEDRKPITGYRCPGCTTHFEDPANFSKNKPAKVVPPVATPTPREQAMAEAAERWKIKMREKSGGRDCHPDHRLESDPNRLFIHLCALCGAEESKEGGWGKLADPCPVSEAERRKFDKDKSKKVLTPR